LDTVAERSKALVSGTTHGNHWDKLTSPKGRRFKSCPCQNKNFAYEDVPREQAHVILWLLDVWERVTGVRPPMDPAVISAAEPLAWTDEPGGA